MSEDAKNWPAIQILPQPPLPTVKIASDETAAGYIIINESEFDPSAMKKYAEPKGSK